MSVVPETLVWGLAGGGVGGVDLHLAGGEVGGELVEEDYVWQTACASLQEVTSLVRFLVKHHHVTGNPTSRTPHFRNTVSE